MRRLNQRSPQPLTRKKSRTADTKETRWVFPLLRLCLVAIALALVASIYHWIITYHFSNEQWTALGSKRRPRLSFPDKDSVLLQNEEPSTSIADMQSEPAASVATTTAAAAAVTSSNGKVPRDQVKLLTFLQNHGRLNNQIQSFAAAFEIAKMLNRTLVVSPCYQFPIGLLSALRARRERERGMTEQDAEQRFGPIMWDVEELYRSYPSFVLHEDVELEPLDQIPEHCQVHGAAIDGPKLVELHQSTWFNCTRLHLNTANGIIEFVPERAIDRFRFYGSIKPSRYLRESAQRILQSKNLSSPTIGVTFRAYVEGWHDQPREVRLEKAYELCLMLTKVICDRVCRWGWEDRKWIAAIAARATKPFNPDLCGLGAPNLRATCSEYSSPAAVRDLIGKRPCHPSPDDIASIARGLWGEYFSHPIFPRRWLLLSDEQATEALELLKKEMNAVTVDWKLEWRDVTFPAGTHSRLFSQEQLRVDRDPDSSVGVTERGNAGTVMMIEEGIMQMWMLAQMDFFIATPGSTFSDTVCFWRAAHFPHLLNRTRPSSNYCWLLYGKTVDGAQLEPVL